MSTELQSKYEALLPELHARRADLRVAKRKMTWLLVAGAVAAPVAWPFGIIPFVAAVTLFLTLWATGVYIATMYDWGYERQIASAHAEIERLVADGVSHAEASETSAKVPAPDQWRGRRIPRQAWWKPT